MKNFPKVSDHPRKPGTWADENEQYSGIFSNVNLKIFVPFMNVPIVWVEEIVFIKLKGTRMTRIQPFSYNCYFSICNKDKSIYSSTKAIFQPF